jgi:(2Fe-2S) ferredoxin
MLIQIEANPSLSNRVVLRDYTCFGRCSEGPNLLVREIQTLEEGELEPSANDLYGVHGFYSDLDASRCARIVSEHCEQDRPIADWVDEY